MRKSINNIQEFLIQFNQPPREYTLFPFWFLNDDLEEAKIISYMDDFIGHGIYGIIPHPRIGLPESIGFMSERWLYFLRIIIEYAHQKKMKVILYDEGMYPSGSCSGKVVEQDPRFASRALVRRKKGESILAEDEELIFESNEYEYVHTRSLGTIRGVHFGMDDGEVNAPPSGDILNPEAVKTFIRLVHEKYYEMFKEYFGTTIIGIFTDEPNPLGRRPKKDSVPWTWGMLDFISSVVNYDFRDHIPLLWGSETEESKKVRRDFNKAVQKRLEVSFYNLCSKWCEQHGIALTGHPKGPMDIGIQKYFHIPGQDIVWRWVEPYKPNSIEGPESTGPKCSASAKVHYNRDRNLNECFGAYGWDLTKEEMEWLTGWLLIRGVDLLVPHAFYYSIRGARKEERPPDVGPHNAWWDEFKLYADECRRLCWIIGKGIPIVDVAILAEVDYLPWKAARALFENQIDFFYLDFDTLMNRALVEEVITVGKMKYSVLVIDEMELIPKEVIQKLGHFVRAGNVIQFGGHLISNEINLRRAETSEELVEQIRSKIEPDVLVYPPCTSLRYHHTYFEGHHCYIFFNEGRESINVKLSLREKGRIHWLDIETGEKKSLAQSNQLSLVPGGIAMLVLEAI